MKIFFSKKKNKPGAVLEIRHSWVQTSINGGAGSKPNSATSRGILGIEENWECKLRHRGMESNPTNPLGLVAHTWQGRFCFGFGDKGRHDK